MSLSPISTYLRGQKGDFHSFRAGNPLSSSFSESRRGRVGGSAKGFIFIGHQCKSQTCIWATGWSPALFREAHTAPLLPSNAFCDSREEECRWRRSAVCWQDKKHCCWKYEKICLATVGTFIHITDEKKLYLLTTWLEKHIKANRESSQISATVATVEYRIT